MFHNELFDMENKNVLVDKLLCVGCLCVGRTLAEVTDRKLQQYYLGILSEIPLCNVPQTCPSLCWECSALLKKTVAFREQVKDCYRILQTYTSENFYECLLSDITRPPTLKVNHISTFSIVPTPGSDDAGVQELVFVKEEVKNELEAEFDETDHLSLHDDDRPATPLSDNKIEIEEHDVLSGKEKKKRKKSSKDKIRNAKKIIKRLNKGIKPTKKVETESNQKIITIELSYEEMLLERAKDATAEKYIKAEYKCDLCIMGFQHLKSYEAHIAAKHSAELGEYICPICSTVMSSVESLTAHYKRHMKRYECSICHKRTLDLKVMQQHYYSTHEISLKEYTCNVCGKLSNSIDSHRYHCDSHKARVECPQCDKTFSHRAGLMNHRLAVHECRNEFPCPVCNKMFRWNTSLKRHLEMHEPKENTPGAFCKPCDIKFKSVSSYQRHLRNSLKHVSPLQLRFVCDECNRRFADKTKLRDHIEEKHLHKTYQCSICLKPSKNRVSLDQHVRNVHRGRPHNKICHHCGQGFPTKLQLESHIRKHTGERPFICEICPTTFSQQSNLYKHNRQVHMNIKSKRYPGAKKQKDGAEPSSEPPRAVPVIQFEPDNEFAI